MQEVQQEVGGDFGAKGKQPLAKALRAELKEAGRRRAARIVEVGCLVCLKSAVTVVGPAHPGAVLAVPGRTEAAAALVALRLPGGPASGG